MPRDIRAYLSDVIDSCDAISSAVGALTVEDYSSTRLELITYDEPDELRWWVSYLD